MFFLSDDTLRNTGATLQARPSDDALSRSDDGYSAMIPLAPRLSLLGTIRLRPPKQTIGVED